MINAPKDRIILLYGIPTKHPDLEVEWKGPVWVTAYWDQCDEAFCVVTGDWLGPFIDEPLDWAEVPEPKLD